jgi:hypothetical protein
MFFLFLFIAVTNLLLGFYLSTMLTRPAAVQKIHLATSAVTLAAVPPAAVAPTAEQQTLDHAPERVLPPVPQEAPSPKTIPPQTAKPETASQSWKTACLEIRSDIAKFADRIHYAMQANDKKINQELAFELQYRTSAWQQLLHDKVTALTAELERDPAAKVDCASPELCLAQIETLQTNLKLLDWGEASEAILRKMERELEAVKNLLPRDL